MAKKRKKAKTLAKSPARNMRDILKGLREVQKDLSKIAENIGLAKPIESLRTEFPDAKEEAREEKASEKKGESPASSSPGR